jgi:predicted transport protein
MRILRFSGCVARIRDMINLDNKLLQLEYLSFFSKKGYNRNVNNYLHFTNEDVKIIYEKAE